MTEEFDKEIDVLLRQSAQGETMSDDSGFKIQDSRLSHLDADEISLFAENALPKKLRENAIVHFADCDRCRRILSDLISQQTENEIISAKQTEVFAPIVPWYRKLFAFPNLAYTLGALALVFSGVIAFTVLQSVNNSQNVEVSQVTEQPLKGGPFLEDTAIVPEQSANAMASSNMSNASMLNTSTSNAASVSPQNGMMSNSAGNSATRSSNASSTSNSSTATNKSSVSENDSPKNETRSDESVTQQLVTELPLQGRNAKNLTEEKTERAKKEDKIDADTTDMAKGAPPPKPAQPSVSENEVTSSDATSVTARKKTRLQSVETTSVGGKTFKRAGNSWVDSAYKNQATTNITRGTSEFKKLDSDLRRIVQNLGGTVTIVWKDKAYRIQ